MKCKFCGGPISEEKLGWWNKTNCEDEKCVEAKRVEVKEKTRQRLRKIGEERLAIKEIVLPRNGRKCQKCGQGLRGPWRIYCPECYARKVAPVGRMDGDHVYHNHETGENWQWMEEVAEPVR